jgi:hypothetical protein
MKEIRNPDRRLICCLDERAGTVEILEKGWLTRIVYRQDHTMWTEHIRREKHRRNKGQPAA